MRKAHFLVGALAAVAVSACGGAPQSAAPSNGPPSLVVVGGGPTCPPPTATPSPVPAFLNYPPSGSSNVSVSIGKIIEQGADAAGEVPQITMSSSSGSVPLGTPTAAPSPFPTPFATPSPYSAVGTAPYIAVPLPTLSPSTTYTVSDVVPGYDPNNPPVCSAPSTQFVGTFSTGP